VAVVVYAAAGYLTSRVGPSPPVLLVADTPTPSAPAEAVGDPPIRSVACPGEDPRCTALGATAGLELLGVSSVHTGRSGDARGTFAEVAGSARRAGLDFVLLGDHPGEWLTGLDAFTPLRSDGVLLIPGQELVVRGLGRTLAVGLDTLVSRWEGPLEALTRRVDAAGGFVAVVHPRSPRARERWRGVDAPGVHGWEALDVSEQARMRLADRWSAYHLTSFLSGLAGGWAHESVLRLNREGLRAPGLLAYDSARARAPMTLLAALNHHPKLRVAGRLLPDYTPFFRTYVNHVTVPGPLPRAPEAARAMVLEGLRSGRVFVSLGAADEARGFRVAGWSTGVLAPAGDRVEWVPGSELLVRIPPGARRPVLVRIVADGAEEGWVTGRPGDLLAVPVHRPGVWRVEVVRAGVAGGPLRFDARPWILSNPVEFQEPEGERLVRR
jgi:hypothetical protein